MDGETKRHMILVSNSTGWLDRGMADVLKEATPTKASRQLAPKGKRVDYTASDRYGQIHRGKITDEEACLVRENAEQASLNRQGQGHPPIDWKDPKEIARYGLKNDQLSLNV